VGVGVGVEKGRLLQVRVTPQGWVRPQVRGTPQGWVRLQVRGTPQGWVRLHLSLMCGQ